MKIKQLLITASLAALSTTTFAAEDNWFVRPYLGLSKASDSNSSFSNIDNLSGQADVQVDSGFTSGIGVGYRFTDSLALELGWEYRTNDSEANLAGASQFDEGNLASNIFYLNGHYFFPQKGKLQPYAGAGLTWVQEIDIDLERNGEELSYSGDGDIGFQIFAGLNYALNKNWALQSELRYGNISDISLAAESGAEGRFDSIDYKTTTLQLGLVFNF